jgi:hypothetical protein
VFQLQVSSNDGAGQPFLVRTVVILSRCSFSDKHLLPDFRIACTPTANQITCAPTYGQLWKINVRKTVAAMVRAEPPQQHVLEMLLRSFFWKMTF